jgi:hypothetical protein
MSKIFCTASVRVKRTRVSRRHSEPFGAGVLAFVPFVGVMPFTVADVEEAALLFADVTNPAPTPLNWIDRLQAQISESIRLSQALGRRQDALMARIQMSKLGIRPVCGSSPEHDARADFGRKLEEVMNGIDEPDASTVADEDLYRIGLPVG